MLFVRLLRLMLVGDAVAVRRGDVYASVVLPRRDCLLGLPAPANSRWRFKPAVMRDPGRLSAGGQSRQDAMELDPKSVFSDEIVVRLFSGLARRSSGCGQILDDEPQLGPRENPFSYRRQQGRSRHLQRSLNQNFAHALSIPQFCKHSVISLRDSKVTDQPDAIFSEWRFFAGCMFFASVGLELFAL